MGALRDRAAHVMPGTFGPRSRSDTADLVVVSASGARFTAADGREYLDFHGAFGAPILGYADPDVDAAVRDAMARLGLLGGAITDLEIELAERLVERFDSIERVLLTTSGGEATAQALRLARAATGRRYVVTFHGCGHDWYDMTVASPPERGPADPLSMGVLPEVCDATIVCRFNDLTDVAQALDRYDVAAVVVEPIPHQVGVMVPAGDFLTGLRRLCDRYGTVLVFDEVGTGVRHHIGGFQAIVGVRPDLTTLGTAIANGYPIGAVGGRADLMDEFAPRPGDSVWLSGSYRGHPAMAAAGLATLDKLDSEPVHEHLFRLGARARDGLTALYRDMGVPAVVTGHGSVFVSYFMEPPLNSYDDLRRNDADLFVGYRLAQMADGVFELPLNLSRSQLSYAHTVDDVDRLLAATATAVPRVLADLGRSR